MTEQAIDIVIRAKDEATKALKKTQSVAVSMGSAIKTASKVGAVALTALTGVIYMGKKAIEEDAQATFRLTKLLKTASKATDEQVASLVKQAEALEKTTVAGYDMIVTTQSQLATFNLQAQTIEKLTPSIIDYVIAEKGATASADDFRQMTNGLAQALNGNFASLTKSGFVLDAHTKNLIKNGTEAQRATALSQVLGSTYAGFASEATQTATGKQIMLNKALEDLSKEVASFAIPVIDAFKSKVLEMAQVTLAWVTENKVAIQGYISFFGTKIQELSDTIMPIIKKTLEDITTFWNEHHEVIKEILVNFYQIAVAVIKNGLAIIGGIIKTVLSILTLDFSGAWEGIQAIIVGVWDFIADYILAVFNVDIRKAIGDGLLSITTAFTETFTWIKTSFSDMVTTAKEWGGNMIQMFVDGLKEKVQALKDGIAEIATSISDYLGFHSPTKKGPGKDADKWMPNLINMLAIGLDAGKAVIESKSKSIATSLAGIALKFKQSDISDTLVRVADMAKTKFNDVINSIQGSVDKVKSLKAELEEINATISDLNNKKGQTEKTGKLALANRALEIEKEIASIKSDSAIAGTPEGASKLQALQTELDFANSNVSLQERAFALQQSNRSESQIILANMQEALMEVQNEIYRTEELGRIKTAQIKEEETLHASLLATKTELDTQYFLLFNTRIEEVKNGILETINLMRQLNSMSGGGGGGAVSLPKRAVWGNVMEGSPYLVWERGPEVVIPKSSGTVIPNNEIRGNGPSISINFGGVSVRNDGDITEIARQVENALTRKMQLYRQGVA